MEIESLLKSIRLNLARGNFDEAKSQLLGNPELSENPEAMALGARLAGHAQGREMAQTMFLDLEAAWPERFEIYKIHCQFLLECGENPAAADLAQELVKKFPQHQEAWQLLIDSLELAERLDAAAKTAAAAKANFPDAAEFSQACDRLQAMLCRIDVSEENIREIKDEIGVQAIAADDRAIAALLDAFRGRPDVHAIQTRMGKNFGYLPEKRTIGKEDIRRHLVGEKTLGIYLVDENSNSNMLVLDLDVKKEWLPSYENISGERRRIKSLIKTAAIGLIELCQAVGLQPLVEYSGNKGLHFWIISSEPFPARYWRILGQWLVGKSASRCQELSWEVFPKQDMIKDGGLGNLVKLPLGVHQKTGRRSFFLENESLKPAADQITFLQSCKKLNKSLFEKILGTITVDSIDSKNANLSGLQNHNGVEVRPVTPEAGNENFSLRVKIPLPERQTVEVEKILAGCQPLWAVLEKVRLGEELDEEQKHALVYIFAHLGEEGKVFIHQVLNQLADYNPDAVNAMIRAVPPNPPGCNRIRKSIPELCATFACNCQFRMPAGCYASPVIHAGIFPGSAVYKKQAVPPQTPAGLAEGEMVAGTSGSIDRLMQEFSETKIELKRMLDRYQLLHRQINRVFDEAGADEITTRIRTYQRLPDSEPMEVPRKEMIEG